MTKPGSICECGCGGALPPKSGQGRPRKYLDGHSPSQQAAANKSAENKATLGDGTTVGADAATFSKTCKCGCNETFTTDKARQQYIDGHSPTARMLAANAEASAAHKANAPATPGICACGCGETLPVQTGKGARRLYIEGHRVTTEPVKTPVKAPVTTAPSTPTVGASHMCACGCGNVLPPQTGRGARRLYIEGHRQAMMLAGRMPAIPSVTTEPVPSTDDAATDKPEVKIDNMTITIVEIEDDKSGKRDKNAVFYKMPWSTLPVRGIPGFAPNDVVQRNGVTGSIENFEHSTTASYLVVKITGQKALALWLPSEAVVVEKAPIASDALNDTHATNDGKAA